MVSGDKLTCRVRIPIRTKGRRRPKFRKTRRQLRGGFLSALIPIIAATIGAVPGIASVAVQASRKH